MVSGVAIIGLGHVGSTMHDLFPDAYVYDEPKGIGARAEANAAHVAFVCVPTPQSQNGACDVSVVESVLEWLESDIIVLRSTVPVGFTDRVCRQYGKRVVFQPEYYGETVAHPFADARNRTWITLGGCLTDTKEIARLYQTVFTSQLIINQVDAKTAELAKYMENAFLALKVTFCNHFYDLACAFDVNYEQLRETWLLDPRIGRSHTFVYDDNRGYGGSCLPKDMAAIIHQAGEAGVPVPLLRAVESTNHMYHAEYDQKPDGGSDCEIS